MELITLNNNLNKFIDNMVVTIGEFDGIHTAHLTLIKKVIEIGKKNNLKTGLITFDPHPDFVLKKQTDNKYITPLSEKIDIIRNLNLDYLLIIPFSIQVANLEPKTFVKMYLQSIGVKEIVVGFDFHYGKYGSGTAFSLTNDANNEIKTTIIDEIKYKNEKIGSSRIKELLKNGKVKEAIAIMGRPYEIKAKVVRGMQIGSKIGLPTANLLINEDFVNVKPGVYVVKVHYLNKEYCGICNIGHNPSFNYKNDLTIEVHLLDFDDNLYDKEIIVDFIEFLRNEIKFPSVDEFKIQIQKDIEIARTIFKNI